MICKDCGKKYVEQTGRSTKTGFKGHTLHLQYRGRTRKLKLIKNISNVSQLEVFENNI